ncbi:ATPase [Chitinophaga sp. SYP-B3965]|uniref:ATPase n=1 Tax=Chitinophaga sp. SYP-B3965 TaxID=2663120 RepID=UPI0012999DE7|nr:ATPase [Chitinophaga sp. SYP-B3965]MRG46962.1 ATPase [Chitinophaga sp. SYP-B3965]
MKIVEERGQKLYGERYAIEDIDRPTILKLLCYFLRDEGVAAHEGIDLGKGLLVTGPIGCGKTAIMHIMCSLCEGLGKPYLVDCRNLSHEFSQKGFEVIGKYSKQAFYRYVGLPFPPQTFCFDDLGLETQVNYWGSHCQVMAEILLSRYNLFVSDGMITHVTTNLNTEELEEIYGNRIRSRMRQMFNLVAFHPESRDKRR